MQLSKIWILTCFLLSYLSILAQESTSQLEGWVRNESGQAIQGATIKANNQTVISDKNGLFILTNLTGKQVVIEISAIGKHKIKQTVFLKPASSQTINFTIEEDNQLLDVVDILGLSKVDEVNKQAYNITAIDAKKLHNTSTDIGQALNRVSGVKIKESGGLGSQMTLSLNGFTGNQVKLFMDGLPLDNEGSSFQLNNIPINYVSRIEVYKGVVPVWLGGDALGGAINLVKSTNPGNYLDVSYSYGSFNTHRATLNAGYIGKNGFTVELNGYQNYSDNNYWVDVDVVPDDNTGLYVNQRLRRFHDAYKNKMLNFNIGMTGKSWTDQFLLGVNVGDNRADIQTGNRMADVYGARFKKGNILQPTVQYKKDNFIVSGLDASFRANFDFGEEAVVDTVFKRFNWYGEGILKGNPGDVGGENQRELYYYKNNKGNAALNLKYTINDRNHLFFNNTYKTADRKGINRLDPENELNNQPKITQNNISSLAYYNNAIKNLDNSLFVKYYYQHVKGSEQINNTYHLLTETQNLLGYGIASSYYLQPTMQLKFSYEKTYRLPELNELFGDVINLEPNPTLRPESSNNFNMGVNYLFTLKEKNAFNVNGGIIYRAAKDYIRYVLSNEDFQGKIRQTPQNQRDVNNLGADIDIRYSYNKRIFIGGNLTYQNLTNQTKYETSKTDISAFYKDRIPNMPYLFGSAEISYVMKDLFAKNTDFNIGYSLLYVHSFYLKWPSAGNSEKEVIPTQLSHDVNVNYSFNNGRYNLGLDIRNITDALLYDNYMLQKPSRNFNLKFRYVLNNIK